MKKQTMKFGNFDKNKMFSVQKRNNYKKTKHEYSFINKKIKKRYYKSRRKTNESKIQIVNPKDPLNLLELEKQQEERENLGLSPLPGDSAFNTPTINSDNNNNSSDIINRRPYKYNNRHNPYQHNRHEFTQYFNGYHFKTKPEDRLKYFLPDWFNHSYICDYGCHRGDFSFKLFERYHQKIARLDCIDVRKSCLLNAKHIQREKKRCEIMRLKKLESDGIVNVSFLDYDKIRFKYGNWIKDRESILIKDDSEYDIIIALGVTKLIHLYYGDTGLEKFLRRACHRLKPGGHLIVELQSRMKYIEAVKDINKPFIAKNFKNIKIQPDKLEPLLASVGFPYCCKINTTLWNKKNDQGDILLCTKPIGTTPVPIRDINTSELMLKYSKTPFTSIGTPTNITLPNNNLVPNNNSNNIPSSFCDTTTPPPVYNPPPVVYNPQSTELPYNYGFDDADIDGDDENNNNNNNNVHVNNDDDDSIQLPDSTIVD